MNDLEIIVTGSHPEIFPLDVEKLETYTREVLRESGLERYAINIVFMDDADIAALNETYRNRTGPTDVLSFNLSDDEDVVEGEVYISLDRAREQAVTWEVTFPEELLRLVTHGLLHLSGRTHDDEASYQSMVDDTDRLMTQYGIQGGTDRQVEER